MKIVLRGLFVLALTVPALAGDAQFYDLSTGAVSVMKYKRHGSGKGTLQGPLPSGEIVSGE